MLSEQREQSSQDTEGPAGADDGPLRLCVATRRTRPPADLIRFVVDPDGHIVPDLAHRLPGRGVWVDSTYDAVATAVKTKSFARSLKRNATAAPDLADMVDQLMIRRLCEAVSIANKAGQIVTGFAKVDAALGSGTVIALLHGKDAAADGCQKLDRKLAAVAQAQGRKPIIVDVLTIDELSLAIGRENVVHAALAEGGAARRILAETERLLRYRSGNAIT